jgi:hypothetical protein
LIEQTGRALRADAILLTLQLGDDELQVGDEGLVGGAARAFRCKVGRRRVTFGHSGIARGPHGHQRGLKPLDSLGTRMRLRERHEKSES